MKQCSLGAKWFSMYCVLFLPLRICSTDQQHQHQLPGTLLETVSDSFPDLLSQNLFFNKITYVVPMHKEVRGLFIIYHCCVPLLLLRNTGQIILTNGDILMNTGQITLTITNRLAKSFSLIIYYAIEAVNHDYVITAYFSKSSFY